MFKVPDDKFPVKVQLPLFLTISTLVEFKNFKFETQDPHLFNIDEAFNNLFKVPQCP